MVSLSLRGIIENDHSSLATEENPYFQSCVQTLERVRHQWIRGIDLEKKLDLRYREQVSQELEDVGQVDPTVQGNRNAVGNFLRNPCRRERQGSSRRSLALLHGQACKGHSICRSGCPTGDRPLGGRSSGKQAP